MSLQVWLPLNGSMEDQGLLNLTPTQQGTISWIDGKIGKCLSAGTSTQTANGISYNSNLVNELGNEFSVAVWVKPLGNHVHYNGTFVSSGNWNNSCWSFGVSQDNSQVDVFCKEYNSYLTCSVPINTWTHLACVHQGTIVKLYKNGEYVGEKTGVSETLDSDAANFCVGRETYASGYFSFNGNLNDLRIYDHALSAKEVKELSKGLVLHYKLDKVNGGNANLMPNSSEMPLGTANVSTGTWRLAGTSNMSRSRVAIDNTPIGDSVYGFQSVGLQTAVDASCYSIDNFPKENGTIYTLSAWGRIVGGSSTAAMLGFSLYNADTLDYGGTYGKAKSSDSEYYGEGAYDYAGGKLDPNGNWTRIYRTFTSTATSGNIYIGFNTAKTGNDVTLQLCGVKLEKGDKTTPWIPNSADTAYTALGLDDNIEYDCSGYGNDGTLIDSTLTSKNDSARYNNSLYFNGTTSGIIINDLNIGNIINTAVTYSFWVKPDGEDGARSVYFGSYSGISWSIEKTTGNVLRSYWNSSPDETCTGATITDGTWQHICITKNGTSDIKVYINGVQKWTSTAAHNNLTFPTTFRIGRDTRSNDGTPYKGSMSDFRIYATALSADDILELYHTSASIDNYGNVHAYEVVE